MKSVNSDTNGFLHANGVRQLYLAAPGKTMPQNILGDLPCQYHLLNLHSVFQKGTIEFRAFNSTLHAGEVKAYIQLCMAISHQALTVASASPARPATDNPAYTFRCWLLRLGMNGEEFKTARTHLLKHMPGNAAWRNGAETTRRAS